VAKKKPAQPSPETPLVRECLCPSCKSTSPLTSGILMNATVRECLCPSCKSTAILARGLCEHDYHILARAVRLGETSWEAEEQRGYCLPSGETKQGRPSAYAKRFGVKTA